jgi:hypothetical protein
MGRRNQTPQHGRDTLGIDRKFQILVIRHRGDRLARLQLQQLFGIDGDGIGVDLRRRRHRRGDDLALGQQALDLGVDQALAELVEIENAADENDKRHKIEKQDLPCQR